MGRSLCVYAFQYSTKKSRLFEGTHSHVHTLLKSVTELQHSNNSSKGLHVDFCIMLHELTQSLLGRSKTFNALNPYSIAYTHTHTQTHTHTHTHIYTYTVYIYIYIYTHVIYMGLLYVSRSRTSGQTQDFVLCFPG